MFFATLLLLFVITVSAFGFKKFHVKSPMLSKSALSMADVEVTWPNNKKCKVAAGSSLKEAAKKAGFTPSYGCEEGMFYTVGGKYCILY